MRLGTAVVELSWTAADFATSYEVRRCDASAAPCTPASYGSSAALQYTDVAAGASHLWYQLAAVNACGTTP